MGNLSWAYGEHARKLQVPIAHNHNRKKVTRRKFTEMPMTNSVIRRINSLGQKERCKSGLSFKDRKGEEYVFDNEVEYDMIAEARTPVAFPDVAAEVPGILTKQEELMGVDEVVQSEPEPSNEEQAMLAAANSGMDFSSPPEERPNRREIIEILNDEDSEILDEYMNEESTRGLYKETLPKIKEDQGDEEMPKEVVE
jgi:hypothetical protein